MGAVTHRAWVCGHGGDGEEASWGKVKLQSDARFGSADRGVGRGEGERSVGGLGAERCGEFNDGGEASGVGAFFQNQLDDLCGSLSEISAVAGFAGEESGGGAIGSEYAEVSG